MKHQPLFDANKGMNVKLTRETALSKLTKYANCVKKV